MIIVNTPELKDKDYELLTIVHGSVVMSKHIGKDLLAGFKTIVGGEIQGYTEMLVDARNVATERMINQAKNLGADGIINVKYTSSSVMKTASEITAFGTAIKLKTPDGKGEGKTISE